MNHACLKLTLLLIVGLLGCGSDAPRLAAVRGKVTLEGKPLPTGEIKFALTGSGAIPILLPIANGQYEGKAPVGKNRVEIYAYKLITAGPQGAPGAEEASREVIISPAYNVESMLSREISSTGPNEFDFDVKPR